MERLAVRGRPISPRRRKRAARAMTCACSARSCPPFFLTPATCHCDCFDVQVSETPRSCSSTHGHRPKGLPVASCGRTPRFRTSREHRPTRSGRRLRLPAPGGASEASPLVSVQADTCAAPTGSQRPKHPSWSVRSSAGARSQPAAVHDHLCAQSAVHEPESGAAPKASPLAGVRPTPCVVSRQRAGTPGFPGLVHPGRPVLET